ncbi:MAG: HAD-IB family hydrolase [Chloroflexi bacterium]|nr:HAD-IB family hydrolase [Chloroflexota bacterium]
MTSRPQDFQTDFSLYTRQIMATKAAFFDVDGTLTTERVWRGMLEYFKSRGLRLWTRRFFWLVHMPVYMLYKIGIVSQSAFRRPWAAHLPWFIRGYSIEQAQEVWDWVAKEYLKPFWRSDALDLIKQHKAAGDLVVLVTAGLTPLGEAIAKEVGADLAVGTLPRLHAARYTGGLAGPICIDEQKAELAQKVLKEQGIEVDLTASSAYADSTTDIYLLEMVGSPIAFHPDEDLRPIAVTRGWRVVD